MIRPPERHLCIHHAHSYASIMPILMYPSCPFLCPYFAIFIPPYGHTMPTHEGPRVLLSDANTHSTDQVMWKTLDSLSDSRSRPKPIPLFYIHPIVFSLHAQTLHIHTGSAYPNLLHDVLNIAIILFMMCGERFPILTTASVDVIPTAKQAVHPIFFQSAQSSPLHDHP